MTNWKDIYEVADTTPAEGALLTTLRAINYSRGRGEVTTLWENSLLDGTCKRKFQYGGDTVRYVLLDNGRKVRFLSTTRIVK